MQASSALDEREPRRPRRYEAIAQTQLLAQPDAFRLLNEKRIRPAVDGVPIDLFAENNAACPCSGFKKEEGDTLAMELVGSGESGHSATDHDDGDDRAGRVHRQIIAWRGRAIRVWR